MQFVWRHHELFGHLYAGLLPGLAGRVHHLPDGQSDGVTLVRFVFHSVSNIRLHLVVYTTGFTWEYRNIIVTIRDTINIMSSRFICYTSLCSDAFLYYAIVMIKCKISVDIALSVLVNVVEYLNAQFIIKVCSWKYLCILVRIAILRKNCEDMTNNKYCYFSVIQSCV